MTRCRLFLCCASIIMTGSNGHTQWLFSPRAVGTAAYDALVNDSRGFTANPAALTGMRDWDLSTATYLPLLGPTRGFVFQGLALGKKIGEGDALAVQYAPASRLELVQPLRFAQLHIPTSIETRVVYDEPFSFGYAHDLAENLTLGAGGRLWREKLTDTQAQFTVDSVGSPLVVSQREYATRTWLFDLGVSWTPGSAWGVVLIGRNLVQAAEVKIPEEFSTFHFPITTGLDVGVRYEAGPVRLALEASTAKRGAGGFEWTPGWGLAVRGGIYAHQLESPFVYAVGIGAGWSVAFLEFDAGYLYFLDRDRQDESRLPGQIDAGRLTSVDMNPYTIDRLSLSAKVILGDIRERLIQIIGVEMFGGIYPSAYEVFAYRPVGKVTLRNTSAKTVSARASLYLERFMDAPTETPPVIIPPHGEKEIPLLAVLNDRVKSVPTVTVRDGMVYASASPVEEYDDKYQTRILIHGRNDWDGNVHTLRYFVTPNDPDILRYTRDLLLEFKDSLALWPRDLQKFREAVLLFNSLARKLVYVNDPKQSADYVQYPAETMQLRGGDCDDMTVCFSALLNSIGISTAFVEVVSTDSTRDSHIYLLFDTGVEPKLGSNIARNPKRYVVRKTLTGTETVWIPVETTVIMRGFEEAWTVGAQQYFDDVEVGLGLVKGWVRIVDVY